MKKALPLLLVAVSAVLLFWRLDGIPLWRDETTTANWGRLMAESGVWVPRTFDGEQLIVQAADGHDTNSRMLPAMQSWLQFYVSAAGFKLFGANTFTARLPFAVIGALCLYVFHRIGVVLFGPGMLSLLMPFLGIVHISFLSAARQSRYYILVVLFASLLMLEFCRYLKQPSLAKQRGFYARIGLYGVLLYLSNYVSFGGTWLALGIFVLALRDRVLLRGFLVLSALLVAVLTPEFWMFHSDFTSTWPPPEPEPLLDLYRAGLTGRAKDFWRIVPLVLLVPAAVFLFSRRAIKAPAVLSGTLLLAGILVLSPLVVNYGHRDVRRLDSAAFWGFALLCLVVPAVLAWAWSRLDRTRLGGTQLGGKGIWARAALLAGLLLLVSPLLTVAAAKHKANTRHYFQILPAALLLSALAVAQMRQAAGAKAATALCAGLLIWPGINWYASGDEQMLERQLLRDRSYNAPLIDYLREHVGPGDKVAFLRNVKGMTVYFYLPKMRWVGLLDSEAPGNQEFRGRIPDDQFDDYAGADWYVRWDPRGGKIKGLTDAFEKVWEYSYPRRLSWWDRASSAPVRTYEVFRRKKAAPPE